MWLAQVGARMATLHIKFNGQQEALEKNSISGASKETSPENEQPQQKKIRIHDIYTTANS